MCIWALHSLSQHQPLLPKWCVCQNEHTWKHHDHLNSVVHIRFTLGAVQPMDSEKWIMTCIYYYVSSRLVSLAWELSVLHLFLSSIQLLLKTDHVIVSIALPFSECCIVGIIKNVVFSYWFLSLSNKNLRFFHVISWFADFFLNLNILGYSTPFILLTSTFWQLWIKLPETPIPGEEIGYPAKYSLSFLVA